MMPTDTKPPGPPDPPQWTCPQHGSLRPPNEKGSVTAMGDVIAMAEPERVHKCEGAPRFAPIKRVSGEWSLHVPTCPPTAGQPLDYMRGWALIPLVFCPWCGDRLDGEGVDHRQSWMNFPSSARHEVLSWLGDPNRGDNLNAAAEILIDLCDPVEQAEIRAWQKRRQQEGLKT